MPTVLSTKKLSLAQKNLLLNSGIALVEYDAIKINFIDLELSGFFKNAIISSQNTAHAISRKDIRTGRCFCVGSKTADYLKHQGYNVVEVADYSKDLGAIIAANYSGESFTLFCGNRRREELPSILKEKNIPLEEIEVYRTHLDPVSFEQKFDGILFYSPSGVKSYISANILNGSLAFCIGNTTAAEAEKHTENIITATKPSVENVIVQVVKKFKDDKK